MKMSHKKKLMDAEADDDHQGGADSGDKTGCCTNGFYDEYVRPVLAEFFGAVLYTFITGMVAMSTDIASNAVAGGFIVMVLSVSFISTSGGHFNPAVTLAFLIAGHSISPIKAFFYVLFQLVGSVAGAAIVLGLSDEATYDAQFGGVPMVIGSLTIGQSLALEGVLGAILALVVLVAQDDEKNVLAPVAHGLVYLVGLFIAIPQTGGVINPLRSFGVSVIYSAETTDHWTEQWIYYVAPAAGAALGAIIYKLNLASKGKRWSCHEKKSE